jgi:hypothetical protein
MMINRWHLKQAADQLLGRNRIDPDTGISLAELRRRQREQEQWQARQQRRKAQRRQRVNAERKRFAAEMKTYESMRPNKENID